MGNVSSKEKVDMTYRFICAFIKKYKYPPSVREICQTVGIKSTASAQYYLDKLEAQGLIVRSSKKNRTIEIVNHNIDNIEVPCLGNIAAGQPLGAATIIDENYTVPTNFFNVKDKSFFLRVKGNSMIDIGILNDDLVLINQQESAKDGDIIAAQIDNEDVTLKRFYKKDNKIILHPENVTMNDIIVTPDHTFRVLGIYAGLMRNK